MQLVLRGTECQAPQDLQASLSASLVLRGYGMHGELGCALGEGDQITSPKETTAMGKNGYLFIYSLALEIGFNSVAQVFLEPCDPPASIS